MLENTVRVNCVHLGVKIVTLNLVGPTEEEQEFKISFDIIGGEELSSTQRSYREVQNKTIYLFRQICLKPK